MRTVLFPITGRLNFAAINPYAAQSTQDSKEPRALCGIYEF
jgi:hypothetical protein